MSKILLSQQEIKSIVSKMAKKIQVDYQNKELVVIAILKGATLFMADLIRHLDLNLYCDFLRISSYGDCMVPGKLRLEFDLTQPVSNKHVLILEDIVDSGQTVDFVYQHLSNKSVASIKFACLLAKEKYHGRKVDYIGKVIPNQFVVGYGMDYQGLYRNLPRIEIME